MIIKFKAFAVTKNGNGWKRLVESTHGTEEEAKKAADDFLEKYKDASVGTHKYYIISRKEWNNEQYKGISFADGKTKTWMTNEGNGCSLLFEGVHFEIMD